jgi:hypothetical protein
VIVPKGIPHHVAVNLLDIQTEDHPLKCVENEAEISGAA